jgi:signal transduction histidine kinase
MSVRSGKLNGLSEDEVTAVLDHQTAVMEQIASGASLTMVLDSVVSALEELMPASSCSVLLLDDAGLLRHASAPTLPAAYSAAIDGLEPGPLEGSCGTAVHFGESVIAVDVTTDARWVQFRELAAHHGLRACWSSPIRCRSHVVGTFAVYHETPYTPDRRDEELVRRFTHLASLAVEHGQASAEREARHLADLARQSAERANLAKSQFVTALSHELRTPLQAITGFTENLQTLDLSPDQRRIALERITVASTHILSIVDEVLDLARVEAGAMPINLAMVDAHDVIGVSLGLIQPLADRRSVSVTVAVDEDSGPMTLHADQRRLQQVMLNLLSNAVRFSPPQSTVCVRAEMQRAHSGPPIFKIHVIDHGPGIPQELLDRLFVPFDRLGADAGREGGAGLGLVLARRLTEAMNGSFDLSSVVGVGTHITITFPASPITE